MPGQSAKGSPASAASKSSAPLTPAARTYQTTISMGFLTTFPFTTAVPFNYSFYANVTFGSIDNTNTKVWVVLYDTDTLTALPAISLNGTINTANVVTNFNNGVWYANYTWATALNKTTLGCTLVSCADVIPATNDIFTLTVYMTENGASLGGGAASSSITAYTTLVSTYATVTFISPSSYYVPIPAVVEFDTNISWGYTTNSTTYVNLQLDVPAMGFDLPVWNFSFNGSVNTTNSNGFSSMSVFNGSVAGIWYSETLWTMTLNNTTLGMTTGADCAGSSAGCNLSLMGGQDAFLLAFVNESGASAGGLVAPTGPVLTYTGPVLIGSTIINAGIFGFPGAPLAYQPLPYIQSGWLNLSWVNPSVTQGNATVKGGYVLVWDSVTDTFIASLSLNNSVNTTNANGVSLMVMFSGITPAGIPYINFTWSWDLTATAGSLGTNVPYDNLVLYVDAFANGNNSGGWNVTTGLTEVISATFVEYPTTVSAAFTSTFAAYNPIPLTVDYNIAVTNAPLTAATTTILVNVTDLTSGVLVTTTAVAVVDNQTSYTFSVDAATLLCNNPSCSALPNDEFQISVFVDVAGVGLPTNGSLASANIAKSVFLIPTPIQVSLISPRATSAVSVGNVTWSVGYQGSWVTNAVLNIYSSGGTLVFSHSMVEFITGIPQNATWFAGTTGTYTYSIVLTTVYLPTNHWYNGTVTVISKGGTVWQNTSSWKNTTLISGLSGAAAGTILLVVGLIVGMIVALVLARAVMGRPAQAPPQPWEGKPGAAGTPGAAAAPNTCSVCGKSFSTPEELAAHGKSEHGMQ